MLIAPVLLALVLAPVLAPVLLALVLPALVLVAPVVAPVLQAMCYKHQCIVSGTDSAIRSVCYGISDMCNGHNGTVFRVLYPKISTGQEKLALTGLHGLHVFATLAVGNVLMMMISTSCT